MLQDRRSEIVVGVRVHLHDILVLAGRIHGR